MTYFDPIIIHRNPVLRLQIFFLCIEIVYETLISIVEYLENKIRKATEFIDNVGHCYALCFR